MKAEDFLCRAKAAAAAAWQVTRTAVPGPELLAPRFARDVGENDDDDKVGAGRRRGGQISAPKLEHELSIENRCDKNAVTGHGTYKSYGVSKAGVSIMGGFVRESLEN